MKTGIIAAAVLFLAAAGSAGAQGHSQDRGHKGDKQDQGRKDDRQDQDRKGDKHAQVSNDERDHRVAAEQQRAAAYRQQLDAQVAATRQQNAELQQQRRMAQYRAQEQYAARLRQQQAQQRARAARDYARDPYMTTPHSYRYTVSGTQRQTNQYGAAVLKQAVNYGYQQGRRTGQADRQDRSPANYQNTFAYRDANYGYTGNYVEQSDYNYYFREGFRRGYEDGYGSRTQYGTATNGGSILSSLVSTILGLQSIP